MTSSRQITAGSEEALLSSMAMMISLRIYGPQPSFVLEPGLRAIHPMTTMWNEMGWLTALGPIAMILFFGGILTLAVLLIRYAARPD